MFTCTSWCLSHTISGRDVGLLHTSSSRTFTSSVLVSYIKSCFVLHQVQQETYKSSWLHKFTSRKLSLDFDQQSLKNVQGRLASLWKKYTGGRFEKNSQLIYIIFYGPLSHLNVELARQMHDFHN